MVSSKSQSGYLRVNFRMCIPHFFMDKRICTTRISNKLMPKTCFFRITIIFFNPFIKIINIRPSRCPKRRIFFYDSPGFHAVTGEGHFSIFCTPLIPPFPPPPAADPAAEPLGVCRWHHPVDRCGDEKVVQIRLFMTGQPTPDLTYPSFDDWSTTLIRPKNSHSGEGGGGTSRGVG